MDKKLKTMIENCIKIVPVKGSYSRGQLDQDVKELGIYVTGYVRTRELPVREMIECIDEQVAKCTGLCIVLVCVGGRMRIYGDDERNAFLFNAKYVGRERNVYALERDDALIAKLDEYNQEYDVVIKQYGFGDELWDCPEEDVIIEAHKKAYEKGESKIDPECLEIDESIEIMEWYYYQYEKGKKVAVSI